MNRVMIPQRTKFYWHLWIQYLAMNDLLDQFLDSILDETGRWVNFDMQRQDRSVRQGQLSPEHRLTESELHETTLERWVTQRAHRNSFKDRVSSYTGYTSGKANHPDPQFSDRTWGAIADSFFNEHISRKRPQNISLNIIKRKERESCLD